MGRCTALAQLLPLLARAPAAGGRGCWSAPPTVDALHDAGLALLQNFAGRRNATRGLARAALGADGSQRIKVTASTWVSPDLFTSSDVSRSQGALLGVSLSARAAADARAENARLRQENAELRRVSDILRKDNAQARAEDAGLRREDAELRVEDLGLQRALEAALALEGGGLLEPRKTTTVVWASILGFTIIASACALYCCSDCFQDEEEDNDSEGEERRLFDSLEGRQKRHRACPCCWCCCSPGVLAFLTAALLVSVVGGSVLWEMGILQPILAPFISYVYVIALFAAFVAILVWEFWRLFRTFVRYVVAQLHGLQRVLRPFRRPVRSGDVLAT
mmetsp:Transcript_68363/g.193748  ORF Transcript_68363/g.193748 Transcript_68363/m.193748 type:complete len:335 (-) Transcript_68363:20-1024(-)